ncbi:hypothetical protein BHE74_00042464 [Ensete ventricosum]|nr:hypothetical protein GW17_00025437 [Ensete ventricosum]RWW51210.1 hypothetical protein BHE74_00042464 [Ensete ventricosum]RZS29003.1 hypothetical protein BHM03_00062671 [Ensete ventricosum]
MSSPKLFSVVVDEEAPRHPFHDACFLCKKLIAGNDDDIFMYSRECRREQMDMDEALEEDRVAYSASPASSSTQQQAFSAKRKPSLIMASNCARRTASGPTQRPLLSADGQTPPCFSN